MISQLSTLILSFASYSCNKYDIILAPWYNYNIPDSHFLVLALPLFMVYIYGQFSTKGLVSRRIIAQGKQSYCAILAIQHLRQCFIYYKYSMYQIKTEFGVTSYFVTQLCYILLVKVIFNITKLLEFEVICHCNSITL